MTHAGACYYGAGTKWCITNKGDFGKKNFDFYTKESGKNKNYLYVVIRKNQQGDDFDKVSFNVVTLYQYDYAYESETEFPSTIIDGVQVEVIEAWDAANVSVTSAELPPDVVEATSAIFDDQAKIIVSSGHIKRPVPNQIDPELDDLEEKLVSMLYKFPSLLQGRGVDRSETPFQPAGDKLMTVNDLWSEERIIKDDLRFNPELLKKYFSKFWDFTRSESDELMQEYRQEVKYLFQKWYSYFE
jgi:hypothetical protein